MKLLDLSNPKHQQIVAEEIARAKQIMEQPNPAGAPRLSKMKIAKWFAANRELVNDFVYKGDMGDQDLYKILTTLQGNPSQYYLKNLIDQADKLEGVAIDDADFYEDPKPTYKPSTSVDIDPYSTSAGRPSNRWTGD
jgi:hypothetical protein